mmetsp:Transcript_17400/g.43065  ORF Transcript_17400/g.43065 Transcript_17400/m.43065 type:complete len:203 (+) Transcript_17400:2084-2692(+)
MLPDAPLDDLRQVLQAGPELLHAIVAQCDVVGQVSLIPQRLLRVHELLTCCLERTFLQQAAPEVDHDVRVLRGTLVELGPARHSVVLLERDRRLQAQHPEHQGLVLDLLRHPERLGVRRRLEQALRVIHAVRRNLGEQPRELVVHRGRGVVIADVVVAVAEQRQRGAAAGRRAQLRREELDALAVLAVTYEAIHGFRRTSLG